MAYKNKNRNRDKYPWMGQAIVAGKKKRKSCLTKQEALEWEAEMRGKMEGEAGTFNGTLGDWANHYLDYAKGEAGFVEKTFQEKRKAFKEFFKSVDKYIHADELKTLALLKHFEKQAKNRSGYAANKDRKNLRAAWEWGINYLDMPETNPFHRVTRFKEVRKERRMPTLEEFLAVCKVAETEQDKLMLRMYLETGARREELYRLKWKDVSFEDNQVRLEYRKNQRGEWHSQWIPVRAEFMKLLKEHQKVTGLLGFVFMNMVNGTTDKSQWIPYQYRNKWLPDLCQKAGVKSFGIHGIRHLFASILAADNRPLPEIQMMLRHKNLTTTQRYVKQLEKESRSVLEALPDFDALKEESTSTSTSKAKRILGNVS